MLTLAAISIIPLSLVIVIPFRLIWLALLPISLLGDVANKGMFLTMDFLSIVYRKVFYPILQYIENRASEIHPK